MTGNSKNMKNAASKKKQEKEFAAALNAAADGERALVSDKFNQARPLNTTSTTHLQKHNV